MPDLQYLDLDLDIERDTTAASGSYRVEITRSPAGNATAEFLLPFSDLEIENVLLKLGGARRRVRRIESAETDTAKQFGGKLFNAVFVGNVRDVYTASLAEANAREVGLRLRLHLDSAPELADLPWEFLYNPALNRFLALSVKTPIVRFLELPEAIRPLAIQPPLRVLVMISSPRDFATLDVQAEWQHLQSALADLEQRGLVKLDRLPEASLATLQRKLEENQYHIFHFIGHGGFDERAQDGELILEDNEKRGRHVSAQTLGTILHDHGSLRLAVLNACEGARTSRSDPFAGVAQSLIQQGIPAVIAMQFEISDDAAATFASAFYESLARGNPVDAALGEVRKTIFANNETEWGTPVLYLRAPDGKIFDVRADAIPLAANREKEMARPNFDLAAFSKKYALPIAGIALLLVGALVWFLIGRGNPSATAPTIVIYSPPSNATFQIGERVAVQVASEDAQGIEQIQLLVDDSVADTARSPDSTQSKFSALLYWIAAPGDHLLTARSFNRRGSKQDATVSVRVSSPPSLPNPSQLPTDINLANATISPPTIQSPQATIARTPEGIAAGASQIRGADNAPMVFVPAGEFLMGSAHSDSFARDDEKPQHSVSLDAYWVDQHEVTNAQYAQCVHAGKCSPPADVSSSSHPSYFDNSRFAIFPVIHVVWNDARAYCDWAGKRLPTEAEWEKAARGTKGQLYPWGDEFDSTRANYDGVVGDPSEAGRFSANASPYNALDMAGNVWEWVNDWYSGNYYASSPNQNPQGPSAGTTRVLRGGGWDSAQSDLRTAARNQLTPDSEYYVVGFRCAQSAELENQTPTASPATPTLLATAPSLIVNFVVPQDHLTPTEYEIDPSFPIDASKVQEFLRVTRVAYGDLDDGRKAYEVRVVVRNPTDAALRLQVDQKFFSLEDRLGRTANLIYFCCATPETFLGTGKERELQLVFQARPEWGGKGGESVSSFIVRGFLPVVRAAWTIPLPVTAE